MPGLDYLKPLLVPALPGYQNQVSNTGNTNISYWPANLGSNAPAATNFLGPGGAVNITQPSFFLSQTPAGQVDISVLPVPPPQFVGNVLVTSQTATQLLEKMLIQLTIANENLSEGFGNKQTSLDAPQNTAAL